MSLKSSRKRRRATTADDNKKKTVYDLMIPLPKESASIRIRNILERLQETKFTHVALTHTAFGIPRQNQDEAETAIPESLWQTSKSVRIQVRRRLNAVIETLADLSHYTKRTELDRNDAISKTAAILHSYDMVSICPRNEAIFQSACKTATGSDIIVLDYTCGRGGVQLPYKIRAADVKAVIARNAVFEIPYAPAILNRNQRKGLIQTW